MAADVLITLFLILIIAAAVSLLYFIPLDVSLILERQGTVTLLYAGATWCVFSCGVEYRNGAASLDIMLGGKRIWRHPFKPTERFGKPAGAWDFRTGGALFQEILLLRPGVTRIVRALLRHTRIRDLACAVRFGLSSPAVTGMVFGWYAAIRPIIMQMSRVSLSATPVFDRELLEGSCRCVLRITRPMFIPALVIRLFINPRIWQLARLARPDRQVAAA